MIGSMAKLLENGKNGLVTHELKVIKREGRQVEYDRNKIHQAVYSCLTINCGETSDEADPIADKIASQVERLIFVHAMKEQTIGVEEIQNMVETQLMANNQFEAAKQYILYRDERRRVREENETRIDPALMEAYEGGVKYFTGKNNLLQQVQAFDKFARFRYEWSRREVWPETVDRVMDYVRSHAQQHFPDAIAESTWQDLKYSLLTQQTSPSMRLVQMAGPALDRCQVGVYNCAFLMADSPTALSEDLYVLMQGTGVGFSVEDEYATDKWPRVKRNTGKTIKFEIPDDTEGWCDSVKLGAEVWLDGGDVEFDYSGLRPEGSLLKTKGGQASGPGPLRDLHKFTRKKILSRQGRRLTSLDIHDIFCMNHRIVRMGGVRRASGLSLSDIWDLDMRHAKRGAFWSEHPYRNQANNSAVYETKPTALEFMEEWLALAHSGSGERGIFNRGSLLKQIPPRRKPALFGTNPCGEIILRNGQFCNLSIAVARPDDTYETLKKKVYLATVWGTIQASMTRFNYLRDHWKKNSEEEALLGVDILGHLDCHLLQPKVKDLARTLERLKKVVLDTNRDLAKKIGINPTAAATCGKPSGDSSIFFDTAAGFKEHHGEFWIRRLRFKSTNPIVQVLKDSGVPYRIDYDGSGDLVFEFPCQAPENALILGQRSAIEQLEHWKVFKLHWTEHNPSVTIYVKSDEWLEVGEWVYRNWEIVGGLSFYPQEDAVYELAPYETIDAAEYNRRSSLMPKQIDWYKLFRYEKKDQTDLSMQFACTGKGCEI